MLDTGENSAARSAERPNQLMNSDRERLERTWGTTKPADDLKPIPSGEYRCRVINGELFNSKGGTPGYKLTLDVSDGEHAGP